MSFADGFVQQAPNISRLRSLGRRLGRIIYKHFVPTELRRVLNAISSLRILCALCVSAVRFRYGIFTSETQRTPRSRREFIKVGHYSGLVVLLLCLLVLAFARDSNVSASSMNSLDPTPLRDNGSVEAQDQNIDFSKFFHNNANHARLPCLLCHRRQGTAAKPTFPGAGGHLPCTGCHAKEFANSSSPVCVICHTNVQSGALKSFPALKSFNVKFDHSIHARGTKVSCSTCHRPSRGGVAMTIPSSLNAHTTCYQCHAPHAQANGRDISSCGTCHQLGGFSRTPTQAAAFKVGFSHAKHAGSQKINCNECHNVRAGMPQRRQVTAPLALNHHAPSGQTSCATCHRGKRAFGGDDFSVCSRCHQGPKWHF